MSVEKVYQQQHENRSKSFKDMMKKVIILGGGLFFGVGVMTLGIAFISQVKNMVWILFGGWIITQAYAFMRVWDAKRKLIEQREYFQDEIDRKDGRIITLEKRIDAIMAQAMRGANIQAPATPTMPTKFKADWEISLGDDIEKQEAIWEDIKKGIDEMNYPQIMDLKSVYKSSDFIRNKLLNAVRPWQRNPGLSRLKPLKQIKKEIQAAKVLQKSSN